MIRFIFFFLFISSLVRAQDKLPEVHFPIKGDLHFISPEPIKYVDISDKNIEGDIPLPNILRLRFKKDSGCNAATVTIAGEKFITQYRLWPVVSTENEKIEIQPSDMHPLDISGIGLSQNQLHKLSLGLFCKSTSKTIEQTKAFGLKADLYHVYTVGDFIFLDVGYHNKTNLNYAIDAFHFRIDDKKITKATNVQSLEITPEFTLFGTPMFQKSYRNIFVLKKLSFPGNKVLHIELNEKQVSGRVITLSISYKDILDADIIPID
jgi:conjugative transposon TraN protein